MIREHLCPYHGWEPCVFHDDSKGHGCTRGVPAEGYWSTRTREWAVVGHAT